MLLQNTLDLSTFEIVRFRIWNQTSQPSDRGFGSKYFNTNSGHEAYCREEIFTPIGWRTAAYMDDIDKINEKLDLIFGDELDTDTIIDSWKEVQDFLSGIEDTKNLMTMLDGKLDKTGGTISGDSNIPLTISQPNDGNTWIKFANAYRTLGYIGFSLSDGLAMMPSDGSKTYSLLHSGNVGDYALKTDGSNAMTDGLQLLTMGSGTVNVAVTEGLFIYRGPSSGGTDVSLPGNYINVFNVGGANAYSNLQLAWMRDYLNPALYARIGESTNYSDWKTIAFTDSTVEAAYKLKNPSTNGDVVTITEEGNVLVGTASQTNTDFKFEVSGLSRIYTTGQSMSLGKVPTDGLVLGSPAGLQGQFYFDYNGNLCLQGQKVSDSTTRALNLNPLGGAVNVGGNLAPNANNTISLGTSSYRWSNVYSVGGNFSGRVLIGGAEDDGNYKLQVFGGIKAYSPEGHAVRLNNGNVSLSLISSTNTAVAKGLYFNFDNTYVGGLVAYHRSGSFQYLYLGDESTPRWFTINYAESNFNVLTKFNAGALIPTGQTLTIGSVTFRETAAGEVEVDGNLHATGTVASGGKGEVGENTTGNAMVYQYDLASGESVYTVDNVKGSTNVIVQIFEWNSNTSSWDMILTDVSVKADAITVTFGRTTTVNHMVTVC